MRVNAVVGDADYAFVASWTLIRGPYSTTRHFLDHGTFEEVMFHELIHITWMGLYYLVSF